MKPAFCRETVPYEIRHGLCCSHTRQLHEAAAATSQESALSALARPNLPLVGPTPSSVRDSEEQVQHALETLLQQGVAIMEGHAEQSQQRLAADARALSRLLDERHRQRLAALGDGYFSSSGRALMLHRRRERAEIARLTLTLASADRLQVGRAVLLACLRLAEELHAEERTFLNV